MATDTSKGRGSDMCVKMIALDGVSPMGSLLISLPDEWSLLNANSSILRTRGISFDDFTSPLSNESSAPLSNTDSAKSSGGTILQFPSQKK